MGKIGRPPGRKNFKSFIPRVAREYFHDKLTRRTLEEVVWTFSKYLFPFTSGEQELLKALKDWIDSRPNHRNPLS